VLRPTIKRCSLLAILSLCALDRAVAQIDPEPRRLIQAGYNQPFEGRGPMAAYAYYYHNQPGFIRTNLTLRAAIAPTWLDSELGFRGLLGPNTDLGVGLAGGAFGDSYWEVRQGKLQREESFYGHGADGNISIYHLFNPVADGSKPDSFSETPLQAILRSGTRYSAFQDESHTAPNFVVLDDRLEYYLRAGLRLGGREPLMAPDVAFELSFWYEGHFRTDEQRYGFSGDRQINAQTHMLWARALMAYTMESTGHRFEASLTAGTSWNADRFSSYRIGGMLPMASEFPLMLPGYYFQEISADQLALLTLQYSIPLTSDERWELTGIGATAAVDYLPGLEQPGNWHSGLGGGIVFHTRNERWHVRALYGYGVDAIRTAGRGAQSLTLLVQYDFGAPPESVPGEGRFRGFIPRVNQTIGRGMERLLGR
jgi:hypothetical protein